MSTEAKAVIEAWDVLREIIPPEAQCNVIWDRMVFAIERLRRAVEVDTVLVPREPTQEMLSNGAHAAFGNRAASNQRALAKAYLAILDAAEEKP